MKTFSIQAFRCSSWLLIGLAFGACGGDDSNIQNPATGAGSGGSLAAAGGGAGMSAAGSTGGAGRAAAGSTGGAGRAAAGSTAAGSTAAGSGMMMPGGAGGGTAGAAAGASGGAAGAAAGSGGSAGAAAGSGGGTAGSMAGAGGMGAGGATFTQVYGLIMMGCSCHVSGTSGGLAMPNKMTAYTNLVGTNSMACSGQKRVVANDAANSVLFHALDRSMLGSCKVPAMPSGMAKWSATNIDTVKAWINAGAKND